MMETPRGVKKKKKKLKFEVRKALPSTRTKIKNSKETEKIKKLKFDLDFRLALTMLSWSTTIAGEKWGDQSSS